MSEESNGRHTLAGDYQDEVFPSHLNLEFCQYGCWLL